MNCKLHRVSMWCVYVISSSPVQYFGGSMQTVEDAYGCVMWCWLVAWGQGEDLGSTGRIYTLNPSWVCSLN